MCSPTSMTHETTTTTITNDIVILKDVSIEEDQPHQKEQSNKTNSNNKKAVSKNKTKSSSSKKNNGKSSKKQSPQKKGKKQNKQHKNKQNKKKQTNNKQDSEHDDESDEPTLEEQGRYVALDCEFVGVGPAGFRSALARVSIVDWTGAVLLDTYVKVDEAITDYRTFVSGIREEHIQSDIAMDRTKCIQIVQNILRDRILIGHGLKNDLDVMDIQHPWYNTRDTAKYEPFLKKEKKGVKTGPFSNMPRPRKLKDLAQTKLGRTIQRDGESHCSIEDSIAALDLYKKARTKWEKVMEYKLSRTREIVECSQ